MPSITSRSTSTSPSETNTAGGTMGLTTLSNPTTLPFPFTSVSRVSPLNSRHFRSRWHHPLTEYLRACFNYPVGCHIDVCRLSSNPLLPTRTRSETIDVQPRRHIHLCACFARQHLWAHCCAFRNVPRCPPSFISIQALRFHRQIHPSGSASFHTHFAWQLWN